MKAAWFESFGSAHETLRIGDQPKPIPEKNEVLVKLQTSGVNPSDVKNARALSPTCWMKV